MTHQQSQSQTVYYSGDDCRDRCSLPDRIAGVPLNPNPLLDKILGRPPGAPRAMKVRFPGNCFLVVEVGPSDDDWKPKHCLDVPMLDMKFDWRRPEAEFYNLGEPEFETSRDGAVGNAAAINHRFLTEHDVDPVERPEYWAVVLEIGDAGRQAGSFSGDLEGGAGVLDVSYQRVFRVVQPTPAELAQYCPELSEQRA